MPFFVTLGSAGLLTAAIRFYLSLDYWLSWLIAVNVVTFLTYRHDKRIAGSRERRVPEKTLLWLALLGGTPGAYMAMQQYRHKTAKKSFKRKFRRVVALQVVLLVIYVCIASSPY
jgi:uncharacterized membrane protein YsdA (DUF1294 family)